MALTHYTPNLGLPYPDLDDPPDVPYDVGALANTLDTLAKLHAPGDLIVSAAATRAGCLLCDGAAVSRDDYAALFAAIGSTYGDGDHSTTFNVPDYRGRAIVGAGAGTGLTNRALGSHGGEEKHVLTTAELASHSHSAPSVPVTNSSDQGVAYTVVNTADQPGSGRYHLAGWSPGYPELSVFPKVNSAGSNSGHNTMPPYAVANVFIVT
jgi:microcystin-dependent protein